MNEKTYKKRFEFQQKIISRKSQEVEDLKSEIKELKQKIKEKDEIINSVEDIRKEMAENSNEYRKNKNKYEKLIQELKHMRKIMDKEVYKNRWWLIKLLIK